MDQLDEFLIVSRKEIDQGNPSSSNEMLQPDEDEGGAAKIAPILDKFLGENASARGKRVLGIETAEESCETLPSFSHEKVRLSFVIMPNNECIADEKRLSHFGTQYCIAFNVIQIGMLWPLLFSALFSLKLTDRIGYFCAIHHHFRGYMEVRAPYCLMHQFFALILAHR